MISLNSRSQTLLALLLKAEIPISTKELAHKLGITPRMVRYSLENIEHWLSLQNISILKRPGIGIVIDAPSKTQKDLLRKIQQVEEISVSFSKNERLHILLLILLSIIEPITAKELQQRLGISRTTVLEDLGRVDHWLSNFALVLDRCQNVGSVVRGNESQRRMAFVYSLLECLEESQLLDILNNRYNTSSLSSIKQYGFIRTLINLLADLDLSYYNRLITDLSDEFALKLLDRSHAALVLDFAYQASRIKKGKMVEDTLSIVLNQPDPKLLKMVNVLAGRVKSNKGLTLIEPELGYLVGSLEHANERRDTMAFEGKLILNSMDGQKWLKEIPPEILKKVKEFVNTLSLYLHPAIQVDIELCRSLSNHIYHITLQKCPREQTPNPLYNSVIKQYSYISTLVIKHAPIFNSLLQQNLIPNEIGYLIMYVAATMERLFIPSNKIKVVIVCDFPRATISLLTSRLRFEFPNLEITGLLSYMDYHKNPFQYDHDLVIATNSINTDSAPVIVVSPLLLPEDISCLAKYIRPNRDLAYPTSEIVAPKYSTKESRFKNLIDDQTVQCKVEANSWEEVVDIATQPLYQMRKIEHRYIITIKEIIRESGPYMVIWPSVVLLHALPEDGVRELCMSLTTLRKPVNFGHESHDPVEIAIVLGAIDKTSHLLALFDLNELIQNMNAKESLTGTYHKSRLLNIVSNFKYSNSH